MIERDGHDVRTRLIVILAVVAAIAGTRLVLSGQMRVAPLDGRRGHVALGLALRHLANTGIFLQATAHPDDENNALLVMLNRGQGYRTALVTATRGNGGQNEIGPEIFEALGVLRTEELAAMHRFDGAEQYFTRAVDFGFSFSIEETFEKWGRSEITGDFVRLMRQIRPDVVIAMRPDGAGGGQHHQASAALTHDAVKVSGDPEKYPEQIRKGLRPWTPEKFYFTTMFGYGDAEAPGTTARVDLAVYDPLLGKTYVDIGTEARSMHKCQGMAQLLALPGPVAAAYRLTESTLGPIPASEKGLFDGIDVSIAGLTRFVHGTAPDGLRDSLSAIASAVKHAQAAFDRDADAATIDPLLAALHEVRALRGRLRTMSIGDPAAFEIDFRLGQKERELQDALLVADAVQVDALSADGVVVPGQSEKVSVIASRDGPGPVELKSVAFEGFGGEPTCTMPREAIARCDVTVGVPGNALVTEPYWHRQGEAGRYTFDADAPFGLPFRPTPFRVRVTFVFPGGEQVIDDLPVQHRYEGNIFSGEKRMDLLVAPALSVRVLPDIAIVPAQSVAAAAGRPDGRSGREVRVTVVNDDASADADVTVRLDSPSGWSVTPPQQTVVVARQQGSQTLRFVVGPPANAAPGDYHLRAIAVRGGQQFSRGYQTIEYPHIRRQHIYREADVPVKIIDVVTPPGLAVGYVMGVGDEVPQAIEQLGVAVRLLGADDLAWADLSRFDAIVTGVRAYERRSDLRANNGRLLEYVRNGGTLIVQYNKFEFNQAQYGPYPAKVSASRVTDESSPVKVLVPGDPVMKLPNRIADAAWRGWVQERGLYFLGDRDRRYRDLVELEDPFPNNAGPKSGALVDAAYGRGRWVYVGLGLWRQLPAGVPGAYQLLANLISLGKSRS